jgi:hypothetical protein
MRFFLEQYEKLIAKKNEIMLLTINEFSFFKNKNDSLKSGYFAIRSECTCISYKTK